MPSPSVGRPPPADVAALLVPDVELDVPVPRFNGRSLPNITSTVVQAIRGEPFPDAPALLPPLVPECDPFAGRRAPGPVVIFLVDGLGWDTLAGGSHSTSRVPPSWAALARPITTVFPTTTAAALTSLSTGVAPATHGVVGYHQFLPRFGVVADLLRMSPKGVPGNDLLVRREFAVSSILGCPTVFRRGLTGGVVSRDRFEGSGLTRVLYDGASYVPYSTFTDLAHQLVRHLERPDPPPLTFAYWDELDTIQHLRGPSEEGLIDFELARLTSLLAHVAGHLDPSRRRTVTIGLTGDHGQVPCDPAHQIRVDRLPAVQREMAHPVAGDRRAGYFAARPGRATALREAVEAAAPAGARLVPMERAIERGLFGPVPHHPELESRLGDLLLLLPPPWGVTELLPGAPEPSRFLLGAHGGLDPAELVVPWVAGPLSDLVEAARPAPRSG